jgi:hypothetical protein
MAWSSAWRRRAAFAAGLDRSDWLALAEAWVRLAGASMSLGRRAGAALEPVPAAGAAETDGCPCDRATGERLHRLVAAAARLHVMRPRCLARALVLRDMLARRGIPTTVRVGVVRDGEGVAAHAWLAGPAGPVGESPELLAGFHPLRSE